MIDDNRTKYETWVIKKLTKKYLKTFFVGDNDNL